MNHTFRISIVFFALILSSALGLANPQMANANKTSDTAALTAASTHFVYLPLVKISTDCKTIPTLLDPANGSSDNPIAPLYRWNNGNNLGVTGLRLQVAKDTGFTQLAGYLWDGASLGEKTFRFSTNLDPATTYYWRVWLVCAALQGPYSEVRSFTTGPDRPRISAPALLSPANGSTVSGTTVTVEWASVAGAADYQVYWRKLGMAGYYSQSANNPHAFLTSLSANTVYEWWVSARDDYAIGTSSPVWQFTTPVVALSRPSADLTPAILVVREDGLNQTIEERK
jgi:hypothetical protein